MTSVDGGGVDGGFEATSDEVERGCGAPIHPPPPKRRRQMVEGGYGGSKPSPFEAITDFRKNT